MTNKVGGTMLDAVINSFFTKWFNDKEKELSGDANWKPPAKEQAGYQEYEGRKNIAWAAWVARNDYPLITKTALALPEDMYVFLSKVRDARQTEIDNMRSPAIQRDITSTAMRGLGDYLIRHNIAGK